MTDPSKLLSGVLPRREPDRDAVCEKHGAYVSRSLYRKLWSGCPVCVAEERAQREADEAAKEARALEWRRQELLIASAIPARFIGRTFEGFAAPTPAHQHALTVCRDYAEQFTEFARRGHGLVLSGRPGTGKSHLAACILQALIECRHVRYTTCMDMIRAIRDTWRRDAEHTESQVLGAVQILDLLVIDEVGMQYGTEGEQTILFDVLDRRYRELRSTIVLTNQDPRGLREFLGERTFDRLVETCRWVPFDWRSYRADARKEAAEGGSPA